MPLSRISITTVLFVFLAAPLALTGCAGPAAWQRSTAQIDLPEPPRELRAVWVATVANIDWPSKPGLSRRAQINEIREQVQAFKDLNLNTIVLQVRPATDAMYPSDLEPWSEFLQGASGKDPGYDPLATWLEHAHAAGLDVHLWINPYRARHRAEKTPDHPSRITQRRPDLIREHDGYLWLDPSEPEAVAHSLAVVADLLERYPADGIHMDDYFYPYPGDAGEFADDTDYAEAEAGEPGLDRPTWRRRHVNRFVREFAETARRVRPEALVGVSPFGIWRPDHPEGIEGFDAYERLAADARLWIAEGWIDYIAPQLYWPIESEGQPFGPLLDWWREQNTSDRHVWPGLYTSRIKADSGWVPEEIVNQVQRSRASDGRDGHIHFSAIALLEDRQSVATKLAAEVYQQPALSPASPWLEIEAPGMPIASARVTGQGVRVRFSPAPYDAAPRRWVIQHETAGSWTTLLLEPGADRVVLPAGVQRVAVRAAGANGTLSKAILLTPGS